MSEILETSVGQFEIDWWVDPRGGAISIGIDADGGKADCPEIIEVASSADVSTALQQAGGHPAG